MTPWTDADLVRELLGQLLDAAQHALAHHETDTLAAGVAG
jgi:hypothetical protein